MNEVMYMVYYTNADSLHSMPTPPIAVFDYEQDAIEFAKAQRGYGYNIDWFTKPIPRNP